MEQSFARQVITQLWKSTGEHAVFIFYAINALLTVSDTTLIYLTIMTLLAILLYYFNTLFIRYRENPPPPIEWDDIDWYLVLRNVQHITESNSMTFAGGIAALSYLEGTLFIYSAILTSVGFTLHYIYSYTMTKPHQRAPHFPHSFRTMLHNIWKITKNNIFTVVGTVVLLLYVSGNTFVQTVIIIGTGFILFFVNQYRILIADELKTQQS